MPKYNVKKGTVRIGSAAKRDLKDVRAGDDANPITLSKADGDKLTARGVVEPEGVAKKPAKSADDGQGQVQGQGGQGSGGGSGGEGNGSGEPGAGQGNTPSA